MKLTIIIFCFNEKATILKAIEQAKQISIDKEIIVIDNCSTDGTKDILETLEKSAALKIVMHNKNMGVGYSVIEGISLAQGEYFYAPCADLEYKMEDVYKMMEKIENENLDAVFGSRLLEKKGVSRFRLIKERPYWLGSIIATFLTNLFYGRDFTDIIATKLIKTNILKELGCQATNQAFEFELVSRLCKKGYKIGEVPVWYKPRTHKEGKTIKAIDMVPAVLAILRIKFLK
ncbi:MAG: glycosyltransferase family 2 protein [Candidatus Omnitrophica bacterium]|nr:glycosyltransferase family 2 protein [Candidatus Omnitrophota bacterium]MBU4303662.1 glycosyltransferase family 2 protein [Candidatus Omnitrophota bacterium]MBU4467978.1 glycosyltransferase family 2 protein [Candidatus Omnitrophota bacterium]MCG2707656.1 glycosyltransferase family 2 protein [Candidatus Omnitrophota bacterium]